LNEERSAVSVGGPTTFLIAEIDLQFGRLAEFNEVMGKLVPKLEREGWKLESAYMTVVGRSGHVIDVFELPDANAVQTVQAATRKDPEFLELISQLRDIVDSERTMLAVRTPYSG
jgi:hypothetical protein